MSVLSEILRLARYGARLVLKPSEVNFDGVRLCLPPGAQGNVRASIYAEKYENLETRALPRYLKPGDRVVEAGAAIGFVGLHCARLVGIENITLIEANRDLIGEIEKNFQLNGMPRPEILNGVAVAEPKSSVTFHVAEQFWSSSVIDRGTTKRVDELPGIGLNRLFREKNATVFICDIEGGEFDLLPSLDLSPLRLAIIELHERVGGRQAVEDAIVTLAKGGMTLVETIKEEVFIFERGSIPDA